MKRRRGILIVAMILVLLAFGTGLVQLVVYRLQTGRSYPAFSSLRADPLGTRALAEALERIDGLSVTRHYDPLPRKLPPPDETALLILGTDPSAYWEDPNRIRERLDAFVRKGGRLVVALTWQDLDEPPPAGTGDAEEDELEEEQDDEDIPEDFSAVDPFGLLDWLPGDPPIWSAYNQPHRIRAELTDAGRRRLGRSDRLAMIPGYFAPTDPGEEWDVLASEVNSGAVLLRRSLGQGEIVVSGGTWWLGNLSLSEDPPLGAIISLLGDRRWVVFHESHLGIIETPGLARMTWEAGFFPTACVLAVIALLFVWRSATRLAPARRMPRTLNGGQVLGRDANEGLVNLLRRSVPRAHLLETCLREWEKTVPAGRSDLQAKSNKLRAEIVAYLNEPNRRTLIKGYEALRRIVSERT